ncbi:hypothetical protein [Desulfobacula sp.]|uniref:hypothetical protein n=1 Tax=Desulfobacula sp. TaxID=2593537 RepID=UPI0026035C06|nr:hypothetical protein [Desulfobacula sp.]
MGKRTIILCFAILLFLHTPAQATFPLHLGGFTLGEDIKHYQHLINMETCRDVPFNQYLKEGEIISQHGFKSGLIAYGLCDKPNKILRIKLKFNDPTKKFFNTLLKKYKTQLGPPSEYKGDPFQTVIAWKWSFTNDQNERISLILQHNIMVEDEKIGNAVKLTLTSQLDRERTCFMTRFPEKPSPSQPKTPQRELWKFFIPY